MKFISSHPAFNDTIDSLKNEFKDDKSNDLVVCGARNFSKTRPLSDFRQGHDKVIVFNQEPLLAKQKQFLHLGYFAWLKDADEVWDYDEENIKVLNLFRPGAKLHILKPYKKWPTVYHKDIDVLFYGSMNDHRRRILKAIAKHRKVKILENCWDSKTLDEYILRSRVLLNLHFFYETALQEQARMIRWIGSPARIISEPSIHNYLGVEELTASAIVDMLTKEA